MKLKVISNINELTAKKQANRVIASKNIARFSHRQEDIVASFDQHATRLYSKIGDYDKNSGEVHLVSVQDVDQTLEYYFNNCINSGHKFYLIE